MSWLHCRFFFTVDCCRGNIVPVQEGGRGGTATLILISAVYGGEWSAARPHRFTLGAGAHGTH